MHITTYAQLVNAIASNAVFSAMHTASNEHDDELQLFAQRAIIDFMLANAALYAIASAEHNEADTSILAEYVFDDVT